MRKRTIDSRLALMFLIFSQSGSAVVLDSDGFDLPGNGSVLNGWDIAVQGTGVIAHDAGMGHGQAGSGKLYTWAGTGDATIGRCINLPDTEMIIVDAYLWNDDVTQSSCDLAIGITNVPDCPHMAPLAVTDLAAAEADSSWVWTRTEVQVPVDDSPGDGQSILVMVTHTRTTTGAERHCFVDDYRLAQDQILSLGFE